MARMVFAASVRSLEEPTGDKTASATGDPGFVKPPLLSGRRSSKIHFA